MFCVLLLPGAEYLAGCAGGHGQIYPFTRVKLQRNYFKLNLYFLFLYEDNLFRTESLQLKIAPESRSALESVIQGSNV